MDADFVTKPDGAWWTWPVWRKALAMATLRPAYWLLGVAAMVRQGWALRYPHRPFKPMAWVHKEPCLMEWCNRHDEVHHGLDGCVPDWPDHGLEYERDLDVPRSFADTFDIRVGRMYLYVPDVSDEARV